MELLSNSALILTVLTAFITYGLVKIFHKLKEVYDINRQLSYVGTPKGNWLGSQLGVLVPDESGFLLLKKRLKKFPKVQRMIWIFPFVQTLSLYWPSSAKTVLAQEGPKDKLFYGMLRPWLGDGLLLSNGKKWRRNRRLLTPAFHFEILKNYLTVFNECANVLINKWESESKITVFENISLMTLDNMLQCTMSSKSNCQKIGKTYPYVKAVYNLSEIIVQRFFKPYLLIDFIFNLTSYGKAFNKSLSVVHEHSEKIIKVRKVKLENTETVEEIKNRRRPDFLDVLLLAKDENGQGLSEKEIRDEVDTFLFEGHDTTASAISWALYNLSLHQREQDLCRKEVLQTLGDRGDLEWEDLSKLNYLTMCIKESLRLHPPVVAVGRHLAEPMEFSRDFHNDQYNISSKPLLDGKQVFAKGTRLEVTISNLHSNPYIWENPDKFDPTRFTQENMKSRNPFAYVPFSAGPRNCIGQNFAMMEIKVTLAKLLKNYKFSVDNSFPKPIRAFRLILRSLNDIHLKIKKV